MKPLKFFSFLLSFVISANAQDYNNIDFVQKQYILISEEMNAVLSDIRPFVNDFELIRNNLESELDIYKACPYTFNNTAEAIYSWGSQEQIKQYNVFLTNLQVRNTSEKSLYEKYLEFLSWEESHLKEFDLMYGTFSDQDGSANNWMDEYVFLYEKIRNTGFRLKAFFPAYDSCRMDCQFCSCYQLFVDFHKSLGLYEIYKQKFADFMNDQGTIDSDYENDLYNYREKYRKYFVNYIHKFSVLKQYSRNELQVLMLKSEQLNEQMEIVSEMVLAQMERDFMTKHKDDYRKMDILEKDLISLIGGTDNYYSLTDFANTIDFMHKSLNPELNIEEKLRNLDAFLSTDFKAGTKASELQKYCNQQLENLDQLSQIISQYESVPYFCFHAYPQFSNEKLNRNLEIINSRIDFEDKSLGSRTKQFIQLKELDLSNTDFSMDLLLKDHENIQKLNLSNTSISSVENLSELNLIWLDLSSTEIDREDLQYLRALDGIQYLNLSDTHLNKTEVNELCFYLKIRKKNCIIRKKGDAGESVFVSQNSSTSY